MPSNAGRWLGGADICLCSIRCELRHEGKIGPYLLLTPLAHGGMAEVWLARRENTSSDEQPIVLKTILPSLASFPEFVSMFVNETKVATQLRHPNIVQVYESGCHANHHYIAMEYVVGRTLRQILWRATQFNKLFPVWFALEVAASICDALDYVHGQVDPEGRPLRLLHRDVTPENVMVSFCGEIKLLDFGIARALSLPSMTRVGTLKGKFAYLAPELLDVDRASQVDSRSDLYSLGVVLYECLTGVRPYQAEHDAQLVQIVLDKSRVAPPPSTVAPWIPESLDRIVQRCIAKLPDERFQSARAMRTAIRDFMKDTGLCPTQYHVADQICGHADSLVESSPPPSMRLQSPHEVAVQLDSGCHPIRAGDSGTWNSLAACTQSEPVLASLLVQNDSEGVSEKRHDWDAAIRRARASDDEPAVETEVAPLPVVAEPQHTGGAAEKTSREALLLLDKSFELLRSNDVEKAIAVLRRAAECDPTSRLVQANLRRLEQISMNCNGARRRG